MPSIYQLNTPSHPFWDFVADFDRRPWFAPPGTPSGPEPNTANEAHQSANAEASQPAAGQAEKAAGKQPEVADPPEVDPSNYQRHERPEHPGGGQGFPFRGRGPWGWPFEGENGERRRRHPCRGRPEPSHDHRRGGPPPFMFGPHGPWWAQRGPPSREGSPEHGSPEREEHHGPPGGFHGPHPPHHPGFRGPHPHHHPAGPHGRHGHRHPHGPPPHCRRPPSGPPDFDLPEFLKNLGERLGLDISEAARGFGLDRFASPQNNQEADFEPRADIFDTDQTYIVHLSLPGAKKTDVGVDWDSEKSHLRIAGVVHRPGVDEQLLTKLVLDGRKRETGVFEKIIRLGTKNDPASIDVAGITAKMTDGVLVVKIPKVHLEKQRREVPIDQSASPSPARAAAIEKDLLFDADEEMHDASEKHISDPSPKHNNPEPADVDVLNEKAAPTADDRSDTVDFEERLPHYTPEETHDQSDWEKDSAEDEGEYVKINVD